MGKKTKMLEKELAALRAQYNQALSALKTPDQYSDAVGKQALEVLNWAKGGDYRQLPKGIFANFVDPAQRQRERQLTMNAGAQGVSALGAPSGKQLQLTRENLNDEFDRDSAADYQSQVANAVGNASQVAGGLGSQELQKKMGILSSLGGMTSNVMNAWQQQANKPKWWQGLLGSLGGALSSFL